MPDEAPYRSRLIFHAVQRATEIGATAVLAGAVHGTEQYQSYQETGFLRGRYAHQVKIVKLRPDFPAPGIGRDNSLSLSSGDFDII